MNIFIFFFVIMICSDRTRFKINIFADNVKEAYEKRVEAYFKKLAFTCAQNKIKYVPVSVGDNFEKILY